ncbi:hypothetical protein A2U01_0074999, partial [Trifolium medium]|nr:hypothetical protein [Trifolium medium]
LNTMVAIADLRDLSPPPGTSTVPNNQPPLRLAVPGSKHPVPQSTHVHQQPPAPLS